MQGCPRNSHRNFGVACVSGHRITLRDFPCMAFNLKKVLKALLLSSSQPLATKDIQAAFTRFHEQASRLPMMDEASGEAAAPANTGETPAAASAESEGVSAAPAPAA